MGVMDGESVANICAVAYDESFGFFESMHYPEISKPRTARLC
jgi:hypothetical protein